MNYLRSLFLNFLVVFFVDRVAPGVEVIAYEQVPNIGADLLFAAVVGFLNASIFFFLALLEIPITRLKLALFTAAISFLPFVIIAVIPFGVRVVNGWGVVVGGGIVWCAAYITNYLEWRYTLKT